MGFEPVPLALRAQLAWERWTGYARYAISAFASSLHEPRWNTGDLRRILVIKPDHLGDVLLSLPAVRDFRVAHPNATIGWVAGSPVAPIVERVPWIAEVHRFDSPQYARTGHVSRPAELREILSRDWDLVIDLSNDRAATWAALSRPSRFRRDVGTVRAREKLRAVFGGPGLRDEHVACVFYRALGIVPPDPIVPEPIVPREEDERAATQLLAAGWPGERPLAALHAGATWEHRKWPAARFGDVARALESHGYSVYFVGGPDDRHVSGAGASAAGLAPERNLAGTCDLPTTAAILARMELVVANDGGVMHLAVAQGARVVGVYGPTNPWAFGPIGARASFVYERIECSPCPQRHCVWGRARCLERLDVASVTRAALGDRS